MSINTNQNQIALPLVYPDGADPSRGTTLWNLYELQGYGGSKIPNPNDLVIDWGLGFLRVAHVDYTTGISTLVPWNIPIQVNPSEIGFSIDDDARRFYIDKRSTPYRFEVNRRIYLRGSQATIYKVFRGTDITNANGEVISVLFDQNGTAISENLPLETSEADLQVKFIKSGHTLTDLQNNEYVTLVAYSASGVIIDVVRLIVINTSLVKEYNDSLKYISGISLKSPFISVSDNHLLEIPNTVNKDALQLVGVVEYSDGSVKEIPIIPDTPNSVMSLYGIRNYRAIPEQQDVDLTLAYTVQEDEYAFVHGTTYNGKVTERYFARTITDNVKYALKLYAYPYYDLNNQQYKLKFFLYSLSRQTYYELNDAAVTIADGSQAFNGTNFTSEQTLTFRVNLDLVDTSLGGYDFTYTVGIFLKQMPLLDGTCYLIRSVIGNPGYYGNNLRATTKLININKPSINIGNTIINQTEWLNQLYVPTAPLRDSRRESAPITPTHFIIHSKTTRVEGEVINYNYDYLLNESVSKGDTIYIRFIKRTAIGDMQLSIASLIVT